ncbi:MAG: hypothetical protein JXA69_17075 [Phycisphaerae bacterium]|nr:hypothetical protein [Phycisphaerae bacterium]
MSDTTLSAERRAEPLPEFWPTMPAEKPARAIWLPWPIVAALAPLFWLMPKRLGPHFAAAGWRAALAAQLLWTVYGIGCIVVALDAPNYGWVTYVTGQSPGQQQPSIWESPTFSEIVRTPLAALAIRASYHIERGEALLLGLAKIVGIELALIAGGWLLVPFALSGQSVWRTFGRCARLTLWCSTSVIVPGLVLQGIVVFGGAGSADYADNESGILLCAYVLWFLWLWICSGQRYAGPADSVARQPRRPQCEGCGYILTGLTEHDRCPECATSVESSLPGRRKPPAYAEARSRLGRIPTFLQTQIAVVVEGFFFRNLALDGGYSAARRFAVRAYLFAGIIMAVRRGASYGFVSPLYDVFFAVAATILVAIMVSSIAVLVMARFGARPIQPYATAVFYWTAWLPIPGVVMIGVLAVARCIPGSLRTPHLWNPNATFLVANGMRGLGFLVYLVLFAIALWQLCRIPEQIRFPNR